MKITEKQVLGLFTMLNNFYHVYALSANEAEGVANLLREIYAEQSDELVDFGFEKLPESKL